MDTAEPRTGQTSKKPLFIAFILSAIISAVPHPGFQGISPPVRYTGNVNVVIVFWLTSLTLLTACMIALTKIRKSICFLLIVAGFSLFQVIGNQLWLGYWLAPELHFRAFLGSIMQSSTAAALGLIFGSMIRKARQRMSQAS